MFIIIGSIFFWSFLGILGFIYWYTKDFDLTIDDLLPMFAISCIGPFSWLVGYFIHNKGTHIFARLSKDTVIIKQRVSRD